MCGQRSGGLSVISWLRPKSLIATAKLAWASFEARAYRVTS